MLFTVCKCLITQGEVDTRAQWHMTIVTKTMTTFVHVPRNKWLFSRVRTWCHQFFHPPVLLYSVYSRADLKFASHISVASHFLLDMPMPVLYVMFRNIILKNISRSVAAFTSTRGENLTLSYSNISETTTREFLNSYHPTSPHANRRSYGSSRKLNHFYYFYQEGFQPWRAL